MAVRHLGHQIGGRGCDDDQVAFARQPDMADILFILARKQVEIDVGGGKRADGKRGDELLRASGHDRADAGAAFAQAPDQVKALISRNAAGDDQENALARQCHRVPALGPPSSRQLAGPFLLFDVSFQRNFR